MLVKDSYATMKPSDSYESCYYELTKASVQAATYH